MEYQSPNTTMKIPREMPNIAFMEYSNSLNGLSSLKSARIPA